MDLITMIIECIQCSTKFHLNENIIKPNGSKVRCTKCGQVFRAYPIFLEGNNELLPTKSEVTTRKLNNSNTDTSSAEQRINHRIRVSVPASCISIDAKGNSLNFNIGRIIDVSQDGLSIELFSSSPFEYTSLSFITVDDKEIHIKGRVVHSERNELGKMKIGLTLTGTSKEITDFVLELVRYHHHSTKPVDKIQLNVKDHYSIEG